MNKPLICVGVGVAGVSVVVGGSSSDKQWSDSGGSGVFYTNIKKHKCNNIKTIIGQKLKKKEKKTLI